MAKVYLRADENEAGVTVEDYGKNPHAAILIRRTHCRCDQYSEAEARAVVEGLLRRMLERDGWDETEQFLKLVTDKWFEGEER